MSERYISDERTIILCVVPANQDLSTSDGIQMAMQIDKEGNRTIGVITKIDIMDKGTDARSMLENEEIPLKLGYFGVKNRSQEDFNTKKSIDQMRKDEKAFFTSHPLYGAMDQTILGIESLTNKLTQVLFSQIREHLPKILAEIKARYIRSEEKLKELGAKVPEDNSSKFNLLWQLISDYCKGVEGAIHGGIDQNCEILKLSERELKNLKFKGGARIKQLFY